MYEPLERPHPVLLKVYFIPLLPKAESSVLTCQIPNSHGIKEDLLPTLFSIL